MCRRQFQNNDEGEPDLETASTAEETRDPCI